METKNNICDVERKKEIEREKSILFVEYSDLISLYKMIKIFKGECVK